jgi:predicted phage terminase large subunit-like protein
MSLDTASKDNPFNDFSVIVTARVLGKSVHVIDVYRERMKIHVLKDKTIELARLHGAQVVLIEDASSGHQLIQLLEAEEPAGVPSPIPRRPKGDKTSRVFGAAAMVQSGRLFLPDRAHWVAEYSGELLGFPGAAHDDQVDATTQLLLWVQEKDMYRPPLNAGPIEMDGSGEPDPTTDWDDRDPWGAW